MIQDKGWGRAISRKEQGKVVNILSCDSLQTHKGQLYICETVRDRKGSKKLLVWFYEASNLHLTYDLRPLKGGSGVHVSRPQCAGLNKDQGFSLLQSGAERSLKDYSTAPTCCFSASGLWC